MVVRWFSHCLLLRTSIIQCATDEFSSFLKHWNPLTEHYIMSYFNFYHMTRSVCVFENFNCILLGGWSWTAFGPYFPALTLPLAQRLTSHMNNSMRYERICFVFAALKSLISGLQNKVTFVAVCSVYKKLFNCKAWRAAKVTEVDALNPLVVFNPNPQKEFFLKKFLGLPCKT